MSADLSSEALDALVEAARRMSPRCDMMDCETVLSLCDAITALRAGVEALRKERDEAAADVVEFSELAASVVEDMSKKPGTTWGQVKAAIRALGDVGDRDAHQLITDRATAAEAALAAAMEGPVDKDRVAEAMEGGGFWRSCSGCHESNEGVPTGPYSAAMECFLGVGCYECGGIGAVWDNTDYSRLYDEVEPNPAAQDQEAVLAYIRDWTPDHVKDYIDRILGDREALIAATLEGAAQVAMAKHEAAVKWASMYVREFDGQTDSLSIAEEIRALATQPQTDALAAVRREARAEGMRKAADLLEPAATYHEQRAADGVIGHGIEERMAAATRSAQNQIRAAAQKEAGE